MIPYDKLKEKIESGNFSYMAPAYLGNFFNERAEALKAKGEAELAARLKTYADGMFAFAMFSDSGNVNEELDANYKEGYKQLAGFKEFLESGKPGEKTNYEKIIAGMDENAHETMTSMLGKVNEDLELGISMEALPDPEPEEQAAENENEGPDQVLPDDDVANVEGRVSAAAYIENIRDNGFQIKDPARLSAEQKDMYLDRFIRIMAARELADSKRGDKSKLVSHQLTAEDVDKRAAEMKKNQTFQRFMQELKEDPAKMKSAISAAVKRPGHGGGLDDMFKDYVKNQAPIHMDNPAILKRYMPTVKERIEILQKQAERMDSDAKELAETQRQLLRLQSSGGSDKKIRELTEKKDKLDLRIENHGKKYIAAEIIALRNLCHADKGHKESLDKVIPVTNSELGTIKDSVALTDNIDIFADPAVTSLITEGHGGQMMAKARELANADPSIEKGSEASLFFNENTIKTRMNRLEDEAGQLHAKLYDAITRGKEWKGLMKKGKELLAESIMLDGKVRNKATGQIDEAKLDRDVPSLEIEKMKRNGPDKNSAFKKLFGDVTPTEMLEHLHKLEVNGHESLINSLAQQTMLKTSNSVPSSEFQSEIAESEAGKSFDAGDNISEFDDGVGLDDDDLLNTGVDFGKNGKDKPLGGLQI